MLVVCDTSPLSNLAIVGRLELLREQFEIVRMPAKVARELEALHDPAAQSALATALRIGWLIEMPRRYCVSRANTWRGQANTAPESRIAP